MIFQKIVAVPTYKILCFSLCLLITISSAKSQNSSLAVNTNIASLGNHSVISQWGNVIFADQPDLATIGLYKDLDVKIVINIRGEAEDEGYDEQKAVEAAGMSFVQIPYMEGRGINENSVDELLSLLNITEKNGTKVILHCTHSQRAGSLLGAALYKAGHSREVANSAAEKAGMTSTFLIKVHNEFLDTIEIDPVIDLISGSMQTPFGNLDKTPQLGHVVYSRQPDELTIPMLKEKGFDFVLSARFDDEPVGFDSKKLLEDHGVPFKQISFYGGNMSDRPRGIDAEAIDEISKILKDTALRGQKVLFHCQSGQRSAGALAAVLVKDYGYAPDDALVYAANAGLTSEGVIAALDEYFISLER